MRKVYPQKRTEVGNLLLGLVNQIDRRKKETLQVGFHTKVSNFHTKRSNKIFLDEILIDNKGEIYYKNKHTNNPKWFTYEMVMEFLDATIVKEKL